VWDDRQIDGGDNWRDAIHQAIDGCNVALLLVSKAFLASEFINTEELNHLLARGKNDGIRIVPLIVKPCPWEMDIFAHLQALPKDGKPIITFEENNGDREQVWTDIIRRIASWVEPAQTGRLQPAAYKQAVAQATPDSPAIQGKQSMGSNNQWGQTRLAYLPMTGMLWLFMNRQGD